MTANPLPDPALPDRQLPGRSLSGLQSSELSGRRVVLGVCGGIAAYKAVELCRLLTAGGAFVSPILTENALRFVGAATFDALASERARTTLWHSPEPSPHTTLGQAADVVVVAPATARIIASYAQGLSDDLLATTLLATRARVVIAPAMHTEMWEHPAVVANVALLRERGVIVVGPETGPLAGGDSGVGRLAPVEAIADAVRDIVSTPSENHQKKSLVGKTVLITAGGTREPLDPVRFLGNRSSGRQGYAVAEEAAARGAHVVLISTVEHDLSPAAERGIEQIEVESALEMHDAVMNHLAEADIVFMTAAVADFRPSAPADQKIKKTTVTPDFDLVQTVDILNAVAGKRRDDQIIVGFAAETQNLEANALDKLERKKLDVIAANDVSQPNVGFGHPTNQLLILDKNGRKLSTELAEKRTVAATLLTFVEDIIVGDIK